MPDVLAILERAEALCRRVAPHELGDRPLYLLPHSSLPPAWGEGALCFGFTAPDLDLVLKPTIGKAWKGRGPVIVVNDRAILDRDGEEFFEIATVGTVLHELAHVLQFGRHVPQPEPEPAKILWQSMLLADAVKHPAPEVDDDEAFVRFRRDEFKSHNAPKFLRILLHLQHRVEVLGEKMPITRALGVGAGYEMTGPYAYKACLADEPERLAGLSFEEILRTPLPPEYWALWLQDVQDFYALKREIAVNMASLLEKIVGKQKQRQHTHRQNFRELVREAAEGREPDADAVEQVLLDTGKTVEDFLAAVELHTRRVELKATYDRGRTVDAEMIRVRERIAEADAELEAARDRHAAAVNPLNHQVEQLHQTFRNADRAANALRDSCSDPDLLAQLKASRQKSNELTAERQRLTRERSAAESSISSLIGRAQQQTDPQHAAETMADVERRKVRLAKRDAELQAHHETVLAEVANQDRLFTLMLEP